MSVNMACDANYSLRITLMVYVITPKKWIFDTGTTFYLCYFKELFVNFCDMESNIVMARSGQPCHKRR